MAYTDNHIDNTKTAISASRITNSKFARNINRNSSYGASNTNSDVLISNDRIMNNKFINRFLAVEIGGVIHTYFKNNEALDTRQNLTNNPGFQINGNCEHDYLHQLPSTYNSIDNYGTGSVRKNVIERLSKSIKKHKGMGKSITISKQIYENADKLHNYTFRF